MKKLLSIVGLLSLASGAFAQIAPAGPNSYSGNLVNNPALGYANTYVIDLAPFNGSKVSAEVMVGSATLSATNFSTNNYKLNGTLISTNVVTGYTLGLPLLYTTGASPAISGLSSGTTYYAIPVGSQSLGLASTSTGSVAGSYIVLASSTTSANTYTLKPLGAPGGLGTYVWQSSDDGVNYATTLTTGTVTVQTYTSPFSTSLFDFGVYNFRYLRFNVTPSTGGAMFIQVPVNIKQDGIGPF